VLVLIAAGRVSAVHDVSDGGLAVALAEMAIAGGIGATIDAAAVEGEPHGFFFGEDQGRYVVTTVVSGYESLMADAARAEVPMVRIGATGGLALTLPNEAPIGVDVLRTAFESWFPAYMEGSRS
jgi:phosphoribosylformylglycinamidine synthase